MSLSSNFFSKNVNLTEKCVFSVKIEIAFDSTFPLCAETNIHKSCAQYLNCEVQKRSIE